MTLASMKIVGVGLNKTGTKTLGRYLHQWGMRHKTYDIGAFEMYRSGRISDVLDLMDAYDSFEDWPWPLLFREIDQRFSDARFVLTTRKSPDVWFRSLCNMAIRMGPLNDFERHIYGYAMPQGHREEHIAYYLNHNRTVREFFADRSEKLLTICWEDGDGPDKLARFVGVSDPTPLVIHVNKSSSWVYTGNNLVLAHANRVVYQSSWHSKRFVRRVYRGLRRRLLR